MPTLLSGRKPLAASLSDYFAMGSEDEAAYYAEENLCTWKATPGAIDWLTGLTNGLKPKQRH